MTLFDITLDRGAGPLYRQLAGELARGIDRGELAPGDRLPTHRALADRLGVTVGTVTRAYAEAERRGLVEARVGAGTFVRDPGRPGWRFDSHTGAPRSLGYNLPPAIERAAELQSAMDELSRDRHTLDQLLLYQSPGGIPEHRAALARWLNARGVALSAERLLFTSGAQHGLQLTLQALCRPGDTILCERLVYPGLLSLARQQQLQVRPVDMDGEGLLPEAVEAACRQHAPRLLYTTPTLQNPTTATMGEARRAALLAVCRERQLIVAEDDVHGLLPGERPAPLVNREPEGVVHIGGLGKAMAPGLRLGYLQVPRELHTAFLGGIQNHSWMISPLLTALATLLLERGAADRWLDSLRAAMRARWAVVDEALAGTDLRRHREGFHGWLTLPEGLPLSDVLMAARERDLDIKSAELFTPPGHPAPPAVRIAASAPATEADLAASLALLRECLAGAGQPAPFTL